MTTFDQIKILDNKIMQNEAQYDLDRKAAKTSASSSNKLDKYEYLTGEDLGLKPSAIEQAKFEYSPLSKIFNKDLDKDDQKEGLFKRLKNIENAQKNLIKNDDKDKKQQNNNINTKPPNVFNHLKSLSSETKDLMDEIEDNDDDFDINRLAFIGNDREKFNFNTFRMTLNFLSAIYNGKISLKEAEFKERDFEKEIENLQFYYISKNKEEKEKIERVLRHANGLLNCRGSTIKAFKDDISLSENLMMLLMILC